MINRVSVATRLGLGFGAITVLLLCIALAGVVYLSRLQENLRDITQDRLPKLEAAHAWILNLETASRAIGALLIDRDPGTVQRTLAALTESRRMRKTYIDALDRTVAHPLARLALDKAIHQADAYLPVEDELVRAIDAGHLDAARATLLQSAAPLEQAYVQALQEFIRTESTVIDDRTRAARDAFETSRNLLLGMTLVAVTIAALLAWRITASILVPLGKVLAATHAIARGELDLNIQSTTPDELGRLLAATGQMADALKRIIAAQETMAAAHEAGDIAARIATDRFEGSYRTMTQAMNDMVTAHIEVKFKMANVIQRYAVGDFSVDMPDLPGQKAQLTAICSEAKRNLTGMQEQIVNLSEAAARGDFTVRGDPDRFQNGFRTMVVHLNLLMGVCDNSLNDLARVLGAIARGDLTERVASDYAGTFGRLTGDANTTVERLTQMVANIRTASDAINAAAAEIAQGNADLSARTEKQAANLEETAAAMEELTGTVRQNAENADQANALATSASDVAVTGGTVVGEVVQTMHAISASSRKIADIIGVIDGIAFQTNILALNAAVEAARAGDQGRGFAVVAAEVRNLAQRSAQAAKEIKSLIDDALQKVGEGSQRADGAGRTMAEVVRSVQRAADFITQISAASHEQSAGIEQVNQSIAQMDQVTQQNAALVEEAAAAAESMAQQAEGLKGAIGLFRLSEPAAAAGAKPPLTLASSAPVREHPGNAPMGAASLKALPRLPSRASGDGKRSTS